MDVCMQTGTLTTVTLASSVCFRLSQHKTCRKPRTRSQSNPSAPWGCQNSLLRHYWVAQSWSWKKIPNVSLRAMETYPFCLPSVEQSRDANGRRGVGSENKSIALYITTANVRSVFQGKDNQYILTTWISRDTIIN